MKEKIEGLKTWVKDHKKRTAGILIAFLLVIGAGAAGIAGVNSVNRAEAQNKKTEEIKTAKAETKKETKKEAEEKKKDQEEKKEETDSKEKDATEKQETEEAGATTQSTGTSTAPASGGNSGGSQTGATGGQTQPADPAPSQPTAPPAAEEPVHQHVYDVPIWGEEPETVMQSVTRCSGCGKKLTEIAQTENLDDHAYNHMINGENGGTYTRGELVPTGNMIPVITGYKCSCGAVQ